MELMKLMESWDGLQAIRETRKPADWTDRLASFNRLVENTDRLPDHEWTYRLKEAQGTSDFNYLMADTLDRQLLAAYEAAPRVMRNIARISTVPDFRTVKRFGISNTVTRLQEVPALGEYQIGRLDDAKYEYAAKKYGALVPFSWESYINDDLGVYRSLPESLANAAVATEEFLLTKLFWNSAGPLDSYFATSVGQNGVSSLPLTVQNLETAIAEMTGAATYRVKESPVANIPRYLVVPPALELEAERIVASATLAWLTPTTGASNVAAGTLNVVANRGLKVLTNHWIPTVVTTGTLAKTTWALFSESIKPCELGLLRGHESPEIFLKSANAQSVGGGQADPFTGGFENDAIAYKVRYCMGCVALDPRGGWASDGQ